ncbi:putative RNA-directed DNA polymerase [Tanacetum coccineum]
MQTCSKVPGPEELTLKKLQQLKLKDFSLNVCQAKESRGAKVGSLWKCFRCAVWLLEFQDLLDLVWLTGTENYKVWSADVTLALHTKNKLGFINGKCVRDENDALLQEQWDRCNSIVLSWILGLIQFLMGLDDVYGPVRSLILTIYPLPDVKSAFATLSRDESHRQSHVNTSSSKTRPSAFVAKCYELVGYPPGFKKKGSNQSVNNVSSNKSDQGKGITHTFTGDQYQRLMNLLSGPGECSHVQTNVTNFVGASQHITYCAKLVFNVLDVKYLNITIAHPNGTVAQVMQIGHYKLSKTLIIKDVLVVPGYHVNLLSVHKMTKDNNVSVPFTETKETSREGFRYFLIVVDDYTRSVWVFLMKIKDEVFDHIVTFYNLVKTQFGKVVKIFRSDNGTKFVNKRFNDFAKLHGVLHQTTCAYTPQQNGVAERKHRHLLNVARALMFQEGLPVNMWTESILTAVYLINRLLTAVLGGKCPYELVYGLEPSLSHLKSFGCLCFSTILNELDKFGYRSENNINGKIESSKSSDDMGGLNSSEDSGCKSQRPVVSPSDKVASDSDSAAIQQEATTFGKGYSSPKENTFIQQDNSTLDASRTDHLGGISTSEDNSDNSKPLSDDLENLSQGEDFDVFGNMFDSGVSKNLTNARDSQSDELRRSSRKTNLPKNLSDFILDKNVKYSIDKTVNYSHLSKDNFVFAISLNKIIEPKTYLEAANDHRWIEAMNLEMEALNRNNTWILTELPSGRKPIGYKWVFKIKYRSDGNIERFKARLVAKGYNQKERIDYEETFSLVVKIVTWKSRIKRYIDTKPNTKLIHYCLQNKPYKFKWTEKTVPVTEGSSETTIEGYIENYKIVSQDICDQLNAEAEAVQIILTGIDNDSKCM